MDEVCVSNEVSKSTQTQRRLKDPLSSPPPGGGVMYANCSGVSYYVLNFFSS